MLELVEAGGWLMLPILLCSVAAVAISLERLWALNRSRLAPAGLLTDVWTSLQAGKLDSQAIRDLRTNSALGLILAAGLSNSHAGRDVMRESIEEAASYVIHDMERYLNTLGTIAAVSPLLGLLGTVIGMITVFSEIMVHGTGNAGILAGGISEALITTQFGLIVAIPSLIFHALLSRKSKGVLSSMERTAIGFINGLPGRK